MSMYTAEAELLATAGRRTSFSETDPPILWSEETPDLYLANKVLIGNPGQGKTQTLGYIITEMPTRIPSLGIQKVKKIVLDSGERCELGCAFAPMGPDHPLYNKLRAQGRQPKGFKVEVMVPLTFSQREPDLFGRQPDIVRPFTLALDSLMMTDWFELLGIGQNRGQRRLHESVISKMISERKLSTVTVAELSAVAEEISNDKRSLDGLQNAYDSLHESGLVLPRDYFGKPTPFLDMRRIVDDTETITLFHIAPNDQDKARHAHLFHIIIASVRRLKRMTNVDHVKHPIIIGIPEIANMAKKKVTEQERDYMDPLKDIIFQMFRTGMGNGIGLVADTQFLKGEHGLDAIIENTSNAIGIFDIGRKAIKEQLSQRSVKNRWEFSDEVLSQLKKQGRFIWIGPGSAEAEMRAGSIPAFHYPRVKMGRHQSSFSYRELFEKLFPYYLNEARYFKPDDLYSISQAIIDLGRKNEAEMRKAMEADEPVKKKKGPDVGPKFRERVQRIIDTYPTMKTISLSSAELMICLQSTLDADDKDPRSTIFQFSKKMFSKGICGQTKDGGHWSWNIDLVKAKELLAS